MAINKVDKQKIIKDFRLNEKDTGSVQLQIAMLTEHVRQLTEHLKQNPKDYSSKRGLIKMLSRRRRFLRYLERENEEVYRDLIKRLGLKR